MKPLSRKNLAISIIIICTLLGWALTTIYVVENNSQTEMFLHTYYEQLIGALVGFIVGVLWATFVVRATFLEKLRQETFSFIGLAIALFTFSLNVVVPRFLPAQIFSYVTPAGETMPPPDTTTFTFSIMLGVILAVLIAGIVIKVIKK